MPFTIYQSHWRKLSNAVLVEREAFADLLSLCGMSEKDFYTRSSFRHLISRGEIQLLNGASEFEIIVKTQEGETIVNLGAPIHMCSPEQVQKKLYEAIFKEWGCPEPEIPIEERARTFFHSDEGHKFVCEFNMDWDGDYVIYRLDGTWQYCNPRLVGTMLPSEELVYVDISHDTFTRATGDFNPTGANI